MLTGERLKLQSKRQNLFLRLYKGHFATSHSHINYYLDVTSQKTRLSEAKAVAEELLSYYQASTVVDTILCRRRPLLGVACHSVCHGGGDHGFHVGLGIALLFRLCGGGSLHGLFLCGLLHGGIFNRSFLNGLGLFCPCH